MPKTMTDPVGGGVDEVASVLWSAAERVRTGGPLYQALTAGAIYIRELEAAGSHETILNPLTGQRPVSAVVLPDQSPALGCNNSDMDMIQGKMPAAISDCGNLRLKVLELTAEVARLKAGKLTPDEFNELCHNLHESGQPLTRCEHEAACLAFREQLYGTPGLSVAEACYERTSPD